MKTTCSERRIDEMGRVVLPAEWRADVSLKEHDEVRITREGERIILEKSERTCVICEGTENVGRSNVCDACMEYGRSRL